MVVIASTPCPFNRVERMNTHWLDETLHLTGIALVGRLLGLGDQRLRLVQTLLDLCLQFRRYYCPPPGASL
jgi:hypothetical protein